MTQALQDKVAVVTGASKGIGADIARGLAAAGAAVVVHYNSDQAGADAVAASIVAQGGRATVVQGDMQVEASAEAAVKAAVHTFGRLDILVNNAGIYRYAPLDGITAASFQEHFNANVLGALITMREAARLIGPGGGSIINIGSVAARALLASTGVYSASKAALAALTTVFAKELAPRKIRVNIIHPGAVDTEGVRSAGLSSGSWEQQVIAMTPLGRYGQVSDITPSAVFLASDASQWITGEALHVSGGL